MTGNFLKRLFRRSKKEALISYPDSTRLIWNKGIAMLCDHYDLNTPLSPKNYDGVQKGDTVWVRVGNLKDFYENIFPSISEPFILVTGDGDNNYPHEAPIPDVDAFIGDGRIVRWWAQNCKYKGPFQQKVSPLPIGIDFHSQYEKRSWRFKEMLTPSQQERRILSIRNAALNAEQRVSRVYADFHFNNSSKLLTARDGDYTRDRSMLHEILEKNPSLYFQHKKVKRERLWKKMSAYRFVISPHGAGLDCHRTWEALALGCYVIVEKSPLDPLYEGLPVIVLDDFREISQGSLERWSGALTKRFHAENIPERLTNEYWYRVIVSTK